MTVRLTLFAVLIASPGWLSAEARADSPATQPSAIESQLNARLPDLTLNGHSLPEVLLAIADKTHLNLTADWERLHNNGVDRNLPLQGRLTNVTVREAIALVITDAGATSPAEIIIDGSIVRIAGPPVLETRVFRIDGVMKKLQKTEPNRQAAIDKLVKLIQDQMAPGTWQLASNNYKVVTSFGDELIITQSPEPLRQTEKLLADLEK